MKKITSFFTVLAAFASLSINAQTTIQSEDFTTYTGLAATVPVGWTFSYNGNYTTAASSGTSGPNSYKFGVNNATITSPSFTNADTVSFWIKGNGTDLVSKLIVLESPDNITYDTIAKIIPLPTNATGATYKYGVMSTAKYIRFVYSKSAGNVAFDDYRLFQNPALTASFTANDVCFGDSVHFTDMSASTAGTVSGWVWNFGDGSPVNTSQNPVHYYANAGTYTVTLNAVDNAANADSYSDSVVVHSKPVSDFSSPVSVCGPVPVQFYDSATVANSTITSWNWNFNDPSSGTNNTSLLQDPLHTFNASGTYTITQIATSTFGCKDTSTATLNVYDVPVAGFSSPATTCSGVSASFTDGSNVASGTITNYDWNFGDPASGVNNTSMLQNPTHTYYSTATYTATEIVTSNNGCKDTATHSISVDSIGATLTYSIAGHVVTFTGGAIGGAGVAMYMMDFGDGSGGTMSQNNVHTYTNGTYTACLTVYSVNGCSNSTCVTFTITSIGIDKNNNSTNISIAPNPSNDGIFSLNIDNTAKAGVTVYNVIGKVLFTKEITSGKQLLDLSSEPNGSYFVSIKTEKEVITKKIIINK